MNDKKKSDFTAYEKKIVKLLRKTGGEVLKYPSDRMYLIYYKRGKMFKKLLGWSVYGLIVESTKHSVFDKDKEIFLLEFNDFYLDDYCRNNNVNYI